MNTVQTLTGHLLSSIMSSWSHLDTPTRPTIWTRLALESLDHALHDLSSVWF